jgi:hypothetical protein
MTSKVDFNSKCRALSKVDGYYFECGLSKRGPVTLGVLRRGDDGGRSSGSLGAGTGLLEGWSGPPVGCE